MVALAAGFTFRDSHSTSSPFFMPGPFLLYNWIRIGVCLDLPDYPVARVCPRLYRAEAGPAYPFGGIAKIDEQLELEPYVERRLAWAGPAANLALAGLGIILYARIDHGENLLLFFIQANLTLAAFNLLPALPLDGGRILRAYLTPHRGFRAATEQAALLGQILAVLLFTAGLAGFLHNYFNLSLLVVAVFLFIAATKEKQQAVYTFLRSLGAKEHQLFKHGALRGAQLIVLEETRLIDVFRLFLPQRYHFIRVMDRTQHCHAELTEASLIRAAMQKGLDIPIKKIL